MKKRYLFIRFGILPAIITLILVTISFADLFRFRWNDRWYRTVWEICTVLYDYGYIIFSSFNTFIAFSIFIGIIISLIFLILQTIKVFRYSAFPSISEAKSYFKVVQTIKEKQRLQKVKQEYQIKMAKLEEEKKKYL
jgi:hypothetical protein